MIIKIAKRERSRDYLGYDLGLDHYHACDECETTSVPEDCVDMPASDCYDQLCADCYNQS